VSHSGAGAQASGGAALPKVFEGQGRSELDAILEKYPNRQAALLPALWMVQRSHGWVSPEGIVETAETLDLTLAYVKGVATFYTMYRQHPVGRNFVAVCTTSPCSVCGAEAVVEALLKATGCGRVGETSPDGKWTVVETECLGACGFATPVLVNDDFIEGVTAESVPALLERYR